jgi:hypothetical protein
MMRATFSRKRVEWLVLVQNTDTQRALTARASGSFSSAEILL